MFFFLKKTLHNMYYEKGAFGGKLMLMCQVALFFPVKGLTVKN